MIFAHNARNLQQNRIIGQQSKCTLTLQASYDPPIPVHTLEIMHSTPTSYHTLSYGQVAHEGPQQPSIASPDPQLIIAISPPSPSILLCLGVEPNQRLSAYVIALPEQLRDINV
jgi:hypothetical protein